MPQTGANMAQTMDNASNGRGRPIGAICICFTQTFPQTTLKFLKPWSGRAIV
jgi:hypothetical protein